MSKTNDTAIETEKQESVKATETEKAARVKASETVIYLGPNLKGVTKGTVFSNGISPALKEAIKARPAIGSLVVTISDAAEARKQLERSGSAMSAFYNIAEEYSAEE